MLSRSAKGIVQVSFCGGSCLLPVPLGHKGIKLRSSRNTVGAMLEGLVSFSPELAARAAEYCEKQSGGMLLVSTIMRRMMKLKYMKSSTRSSCETLGMDYSKPL